MNELQAHPSHPLLTAFRSGRLGSEEFAAVQAHLANCDACAAFLSSPLGTGGTAGGETTPAAPILAPEDVPEALARCSRYRVLRVLGRGGMGAVYLAEHAVMERLVALKTIRADFAAGTDAAARFRQEIKAAARLSHPNIVQAFDADQADDLCFLVMEYVEGTNVAAWVEQHTPLPVAEACDAVRQAALGLQFAHEHGFVHRDVKPQNLMRTPTGQIKILDFGLARPPNDETAGLTQLGTIMGTHDYMAPEQARDSHSADGRADVYSLGCTLYFLLAGRPPFPGGTAVEKIIAHSERRPGRLADLRRDVPEGLQTLLDRMLAKDPAQRCQTAGEVAAALQPYIAAPPEKSSSRRRWLIVAAGILFVPLAAAVYHFVTERGIEGRRIEPDKPSAVAPAQAALPGPFIGCASEPNSLAFTRDGRRILAAGEDGKILVWDVASTKLERTLPGHEGGCWTAVFVSADRVLSGGDDGAVRLWDLSTDKQLDPLSRGSGRVLGVAVSADGKRAASAEDRGEGKPPLLRVWDLETRQEITRFIEHKTLVWSLAFSPDGRRIVSGDEKEVRVWDAATGRSLAEHKSPGMVSVVAWAPDGRRVVFGGEDGAVRIWDVEANEETAVMPGRGAWMRRAAFTPDGRRVLSQDDDGLCLWDAATGQKLGGQVSPAASGCILLPDGIFAVYGDKEMNLQAWRLP